MAITLSGFQTTFTAQAASQHQLTGTITGGTAPYTVTLDGGSPVVTAFGWGPVAADGAVALPFIAPIPPTESTSSCVLRVTDSGGNPEVTHAFNVTTGVGSLNPVSGNAALLSGADVSGPNNANTILTSDDGSVYTITPGGSVTVPFGTLSPIVRTESTALYLTFASTAGVTNGAVKVDLLQGAPGSFVPKHSVTVPVTAGDRRYEIVVPALPDIDLGAAWMRLTWTSGTVVGGGVVIADGTDLLTSKQQDWDATGQGVTLNTASVSSGVLSIPQNTSAFIRVDNTSLGTLPTPVTLAALSGRTVRAKGVSPGTNPWGLRVTAYVSSGGSTVWHSSVETGTDNVQNKTSSPLVIPPSCVRLEVRAIAGSAATGQLNTGTTFDLELGT